ncbi:MAG: FAD:protein FMN transferase [Deltaproteobacteria bacterium]|nr:FAD:protein FMN transferase [Deltaproteobacteria bacterium]
MRIPDNLDGEGLTRRQMLALCGSAFVLLLAPPVLRRRRRLVTRTIPVMGTLAEVVVVHDDRREAEAAIDTAFERLRWVDRTMSRHQASSDIGRVNAVAWREAVEVHPATARVVAEALRWAEVSDGAFDPGLARLMEIWDVGNRHAPPPREALAHLAGRRLYRAIAVDRWQGKPVVRFLNRETGIDLGGIAKGYAVDLAVEALRACGIRDAVVNAGGDLSAMGRSLDGDAWRVGIRSPADPARIEGVIEIADEAVATSGDYLQGFVYRDRRYHHIMDPARAEPRVTAVHSVTVRAESCLTADAAATAVFGAGRQEAERLLARAAPHARMVSVL